MKHQIQIMRPGEAAKVRRSRVPMHTRVRQVLAAIETVHVKGVEEFDSSHLAAEIGIASGAVVYALNELHVHGVVICTTPDQLKYRKWRVSSWEKVIAFRQALEAGSVTLDEVKIERKGLVRRLLDAVTLRVNQGRRLSEAEDRLLALEAKFTKLVNDLGGE